MHRTLEISDPNASLRVLASSESRKTGIERSKYPNRAVTLIEQSPQQTIPKSASPIKNFWLHHSLQTSITRELLGIET